MKKYTFGINPQPDYSGTLELTSVSDVRFSPGWNGQPDCEFVTVAGVGSDGLKYVRTLGRFPDEPKTHERARCWQIVSTHYHGSPDALVRNLPGGKEVHSGIA